MKTKKPRMPEPGMCLALVGLALIYFLVLERYALPTIHRHLAFCPLTLSKFDESKAIPIVYGLPTPHAVQEAKKGRLLLGGCLLGSTAAVCPRCHVGVMFRDWETELKGLGMFAK